MNLSTKCNCCCHEDVCRHKEEYIKAVKAIKDTSWDVGGGTVVCLKDSNIVSVSIGCQKFNANLNARMQGRTEK